MCGARNLGEALRRIHEGAAMIRSKGAAGTGDVVQAVTHVRTIAEEISALKGMTDDALVRWAGKERLPVELVKEARDLGRLPVVNFAAGGVATPADAAMMMQLGCDGVFVGSVRAKKKERNKSIAREEEEEEQEEEEEEEEKR